MITLKIGDSRELIKTLDNKSIDCVMTSPPYWGLRDYGHPDQIGLEKTPEEYLNKLFCFFDDVKLKLKDEGNCFVNLGDTYSNSGGSGTKPENHTQFGKLINLGTAQKPHKVNNLPSKCLCMIPQRFAWGMIERNWVLRNEIIWAKPNHMPESVTDRLTKSHEVIYHFVKQKKYYYDIDAIREPHKEESKRRALRGNTSKNKYASGIGLPIGVHANTMSQEREYVGYNNMENDIKNGNTPLNPLGKNLGDVWCIPTQPYPESHFATFPLEFIRRPILAGCPVGGTVLDPFGGSGTVGEFCRKNNRNAILFELNPEYKTLIEERAMLNIVEL